MEAHRHVDAAEEAAADYEPAASLLRYSPALVLIVIAIADIQRWADPDLWGHVKFGRAMLAWRHLTLRDTYSYSAHWHVWLNHEWLSEILMGAIYKAFGVIGLKLMKFAFSAAMILSLTLGIADSEAPLTTQFAILLAAAVAVGPQMQFRPQLFTFAMLAALLAILARYLYREVAPVWLAIPMMALWANLHGGFVIGIATLAIFSGAVTIQDFVEGREMERAMRLVGIVVAATIATLITPYGIGTWRAVSHAIANPQTRKVIDDWQPLLKALIAMWYRNPVGMIPMIIAIAMFVSLGLAIAENPRRGDVPMIALAVVMISAAFVAIRNLPLGVIATVIPLARHSSVSSGAQPQAPARNWIHEVVFAGVALALMIGSGLFSSKLRAGDPRPVGAVAFMEEHGLNGNILADFRWGEYLIWHMTPASKVFVDGRYDTVLPPQVINDYLALHYGKPGAINVLREYPHDYVLLSPDDEPALAVMATAPEWRQIYRDANCILFVRTDSTAAKIPAVVVSAQNTPRSYFP